MTVYSTTVHLFVEINAEKAACHYTVDHMFSFAVDHTSHPEKGHLQVVVKLQLFFLMPLSPDHELIIASSRVNKACFLVGSFIFHVEKTKA